MAQCCVGAVTQWCSVLCWWSGVGSSAAQYRVGAVAGGAMLLSAVLVKWRGRSAAECRVGPQLQLVSLMAPEIDQITTLLPLVCLPCCHRTRGDATAMTRDFYKRQAALMCSVYTLEVTQQYYLTKYFFKLHTIDITHPNKHHKKARVLKIKEMYLQYCIST